MSIYKTKKGRYKIKNASGMSQTKGDANKRLRAIKAGQYKKRYSL